MSENKEKAAALQFIFTQEGIERRGIVLATIIKLKQICNHSDQYLGQETFEA